MTMNNEGAPLALFWQILEERKDTLETFSNEANAWLNEHPTIKARVDVLLGLNQTAGDAEAILNYLRSEAHPAAIFALAMLRNFANVPGVQMDGAMLLIRTVFATGYQQALRDAMDEEIVV